MSNNNSFGGKLRKVLASMCSLFVGASGVSQANPPGTNILVEPELDKKEMDIFGFGDVGWKLVSDGINKEGSWLNDIYYKRFQRICYVEGINVDVGFKPENGYVLFSVWCSDDKVISISIPFGILFDVMRYFEDSYFPDISVEEKIKKLSCAERKLDENVEDEVFLRFILWAFCGSNNAIDPNCGANLGELKNDIFKFVINFTDPSGAGARFKVRNVSDDDEELEKECAVLKPGYLLENFNVRVREVYSDLGYDVTSIKKMASVINQFNLEKQNWLARCEQLNAEIITLQRKGNKLTAEIMTLQHKNDELEAEKKKMQRERNRLNSVNEYYRRRYEQIHGESGNLQQQHNALVVEKNNLQQQYNALVVEKNNLQQKCSALETEKNNLQQLNNQLSAGDLQRQYNNLNAEKLRLENRIEALDNEKVDLNQRINALNNDKNSLNQRINALNNEKNSLNQRINDLNNEKAGLDGRINALNNEKNSLNQQLNTLNGEKDDLNQQLNTLNGEKNDLNQRINALDAEKKKLETQKRIGRALSALIGLIGGGALVEGAHRFLGAKRSGSSEVNKGKTSSNEKGEQRAKRNLKKQKN